MAFHKKNQSANQTIQDTDNKKIPIFTSISSLHSIKTLEDIDKNVILQEETVVEDDTINFEPISIHSEEFQEVYKNLIKVVESKPSMKTILDRYDFQIKDNVWYQVVFNEFEKQTIENSKEEILNHVRQNLNNPTVQLKILVDPSKAQEFLNTLSPNEKKIQKIFEKHPSLSFLFEAFELNIVSIQ